MPVGLIALLIVAGLILFGLAHRVLDRLHLTDKQALVIIALVIAGSYIDIPLGGDQAQYSINVGGALLPAALAVYLLVRAGTTWERVRALLAAAITAVAVYYLAQWLDASPRESYFLDPVWLFSLVGGIIGYLFGRSRRAAFVAGTLGLLLTDLARMAVTIYKGLPRTVNLGGAGAFDQIVLAGIIAVVLADLLGESRERLQGGPYHSHDRPASLDNEEFAHELTGEYPSGPDERIKNRNEAARRGETDEPKS